jgi:hypothetical protein
MARRAGSALAGMLALAAIAVPIALAAAQAPALAAAAQPGGPQVRITITGMNPRWASAGSTITVTGSLTNTSGQRLSHPSVQLLSSSTPISSLAELQQGLGQFGGLADADVPGGSWSSTGQLAPGALVTWSIRVRASGIGMTTFGVYPLTAQAQDALGTPLASSSTYLPYMPARKGPDSNSRPAPAKIAWVWPLVDTPVLDAPWQSNCTGPQAQALAVSLASGGRLSGLVTAARDDGVTWAVDPALLANVKALTSCTSTNPQLARVASGWLTEFISATSGQPLFVTPYGDPNLTSLIRQSHADDVQRSFELGRTISGRILDRDVTPQVGNGATTTLAQAAGIAWPTNGTAGYPTVENLAAKDGVRTLLLASSALPSEQATAAQTPDGVGGYVTVLLADDSLTQLLGSATSAPGSAFATSQQFLAQTALLVQQDPADPEPVIAAPPQRWQPPAGLAATLLADTASAPWLRSASLTSLASAKKMPAVQLASVSNGQSFGKKELAAIRALDVQIAQLQTLKAYPNLDPYLAVSTIESSAWQGSTRGTAKAMLIAVAKRIAEQSKDVQIVAESRITLGGLKGSVPVSIDNRLGYAVQVRLQLQFNQSSGIKIDPSPPGLVTIQAHTVQPIRLRVQATQVGSTTIAMRLVNRNGQALPNEPVLMTVQATQVGVLGMIIFAAALGVFLIAAAARAVRRGRAPPPTDQGIAEGPAVDQGDEGSEPAAEPDTVMPERTGLGTANTPGL